MTRALVFLHGYDDDVDTWDDPAGAIAPDGATAVRLRGRLVLTTGKRAWFETDERTGPVVEQVRAALADVERAVAELEADGIERREVVLAGFSQGAALALLWARTTASDPVGALVAIAGWFPDTDGIDPFAWTTFAATHTLVACGTDDEAVPSLLSRSAAKVLQRDGHDVTLVELDAGHDPRPFVPAVRAFLADLAEG